MQTTSTFVRSVAIIVAALFVLITSYYFLYDVEVTDVKAPSLKAPSASVIVEDNGKSASPSPDLSQKPLPSKVPYKPRPSDDFVVDPDKLLPRCDMSKGAAEHCISFLANNEKDYLIHHSATPNKVQPPRCIQGKEPTMLFHVYWKGAFSDKVAFHIKSFLFSQPLECSRLWLWIEDADDLGTNEEFLPLLKFVSRYIEVKPWNVDEQMSAYPDLYGSGKDFLAQRDSISTSDFVRFALLNRYGGMYCDSDTLYLRDMRPLYHGGYEFAYRWSYVLEYNTAILRLHQEGAVVKKIIKKSRKNDWKIHPMDIQKYLNEPDDETNSGGSNPTAEEQLRMLPVPLFDPVWLKFDGRQPFSVLSPNLRNFDDFFSEQVIPDEFPGTNYDVKDRHAKNFFDGAFAYHWHNRWTAQIIPQSWAGVLLNEYNQFISNNGSNLYGEQIPQI